MVPMIDAPTQCQSEGPCFAVDKLTEALNEECADIKPNKQPRIPRGLDERNVFSCRETNSATKHHVDRRCEKERSHEQQRSLGDEGTPCFVIEMRAYSCTKPTYFACIAMLDACFFEVKIFTDKVSRREHI